MSVWTERTRVEAPRETRAAQARRSVEDGQCVLCGGPIGHGDWQVMLLRHEEARRREPAHTHCAGDYGWEIR